VPSPSVFISYSQDSDDHNARVLELANRLRADGVDALIDQYESSPPEGWPKWMDRHLAKSDFVLVVCTETYYRRVMGEEGKGRGRGVKWESTLTYQHLYDSDSLNIRFIPVLFEDSKDEYIPTPLKGATRYWIETPDGYDELYLRLTGQDRIKKPELGTVVSKNPKTSDDLRRSAKEITTERIRNLLSLCEYERAIIECDKVLGTDPFNPELNLLYAIAMLERKGADSYNSSKIKRIEKHLENACKDQGLRPTALVIWGLIKYDHYIVNGLLESKPTFEEIRDSLNDEKIESADVRLLNMIRASQSAYNSLGTPQLLNEKDQ